ncbi:MAG: hypothetical protein QOH09_435 [Pseudonocardiales bacterium]|jgi:hypothetical protein|nr:hypothetical protein [Pseudonocardiales bacterium]
MMGLRRRDHRDGWQSMRDLSVAAAGGVGAVDSTLTGVLGMVAVTELVDCLNMIKLLAAAIGPIKDRDRVHTGGELLVGMAQRS